jgi:anti-sigma B factor antagonist
VTVAIPVAGWDGALPLRELMASFSARVLAPSGSRNVLELAGEIDLATSQVVSDRGAQCLDQPGITLLIVDLAAVTFMDSTALGALVRLRNLAVTQGKQLRLANVPTRVGRLLELVGLTAIFEIEIEIESDPADARD